MKKCIWSYVEPILINYLYKQIVNLGLKIYFTNGQKFVCVLGFFRISTWNLAGR